MPTDSEGRKLDLTRINNVEEIYREEMAPTVVSVGYDTVRQTVKTHSFSIKDYFYPITYLIIESRH